MTTPNAGRVVRQTSAVVSAALAVLLFGLGVVEFLKSPGGALLQWALLFALTSAVALALLAQAVVVIRRRAVPDVGRTIWLHAAAWAGHAALALFVFMRVMMMGPLDWPAIVALGVVALNATALILARPMSPAGACPSCGYDLRGAAGRRCPECGRDPAVTKT